MHVFCPEALGNRKTVPILLALILSGLSAVAGSTNVIDFETLAAGGNIYTNAVITRVTPAYVAVAYQGGLTQIAMSNLPAADQARFGYDPEKAAQFLKEEDRRQSERRAAYFARHAALMARPGTNRLVRIKAIIDETSNGGIPLCAADVPGDGILVSNFPDPVRQFLARYGRLQADVAAARQKLDHLRASEPPPAKPSRPHMGKTGATRDNFTGVTYLLPVPKPKDPVADWKKACQQAEDRLEALNAELDTMKTNYDRSVAIMAYPSGEFFGKKPIWVCTGTPASLAR